MALHLLTRIRGSVESLMIHRYDVQRVHEVRDPDTGAVNNVYQPLVVDQPGRIVTGGTGEGFARGSRPGAAQTVIVGYEPYLIVAWDADVIMGDHLTIRILDEAGTVLQTVTAIAGMPASRTSHKRITLTDIERA